MYKRLIKIIFSIDFFAIIAMLTSALLPLTWSFSLPKEFWIKQGVEYSLFGVLYVVNLAVFFPKLLDKGKRLSFILAIVASLVSLILFMWWFGNLIHVDEAFAKVFSKPARSFKSNPFHGAQAIICSAGIFLGLSYISAVSKRLQQSQLAFQVSEKEKVSAELAYLKAQINPHFFFNSLHTIYSLTDTEPASAKNAIYNLSHIMRYVLYETKNDHTSLKKEIGFIEDYIALMKVRISRDVQIIFDKHVDVHDMQIAPMLFLPFVENAFKHGISALDLSYIYIEIRETVNELRFEVRNSLFENLGTQLDENSGIGISNTKRRLDLLYPGKYTLEVEPDILAKEYIVILILNK